MRLNLIGVLKKPNIPNIKKEQTKHKEQVKEYDKKNNDYVIISTETIPVEFYCELPTKVKEQLIRNLSGGIESYDIPAHSSPRTVNIAI